MFSLYSRCITFVFAIFMAATFSVFATENLPGVWREFEEGGWHTAAKQHDGASGGRRVSWFDQPGRAVYVEFDLSEAMDRAILFIRASRAPAADGHMDVAFGPIEDGTRPQDVPRVGHLAMPSTRGWNNYRWVSTTLDDLAAGRYYLVLRYDEQGGPFEPDVAALVPDDPESRWMPPNTVEDGEFVGTGEMLEQPRSDDLLTEARLAEIQEAREQRQREERERAARVAVISDPANRLDYRISWFGNDIAFGPDISGHTGHTPHNVWDIFVTPDGNLFTNVHWEEHGANVTQFRDGEWINDARIGNHGGGRAVTANSTYLYFAGNRHRTGEQGIDRRTLTDISRQAWNVHVDCGTVHGLAATEERVFAAVPGDNQIKVFDPDLNPLESWELENPGKMTLDRQGRLWIILPEENRIVRYTQQGERLPQAISLDRGVQPNGLAVDHRNRLLVADAGPSEQVLIFDNIENDPTLVDRFGEPGGVYSGVAGRLGPQRFVRLTGVGADAEGNIYVASRASNNGSTMLQSYAPDGELLWQKQCHIWIDTPALHPDQPDTVYSTTAKLRVDFDAPINENWQAEALTVHHRAFTDDYRHRMGGSGSTFLHRLENDGLYQFIVDMPGKTTYVYRFDPENHGEVAVPAGFIDQRRIWVDRDGTGRRDTAGLPGNTFDLRVRGVYNNDRLHLTATVTDEHGNSRELQREFAPDTIGDNVRFGIHAGGERVYRFSRFSVRIGDEQSVWNFGNLDNRDSADGFAMNQDHWSMHGDSLRARGNRRGGRPRAFTASRDFPNLTRGDDFEIEFTVRASGGRLYGDHFGLHLQRGEDWRTGIGIVVANNQDHPLLQFRRHFSGDVIESRPLSDEIVAMERELTTVGAGVASDGAIWNATHGLGLFRFPVQGFTQAGAPIYTVESREDYNMPPGMVELRRVHHFPERDGLLLVNGFTEEHRNVRHHWKRAGKVVRLYENWQPGTPSEDWQLRWELVPPYEDRHGGEGGDANLMSFDIAGDYLFVAREGQSGQLNVNRGHVDVYRLDNGEYVGWMEPDADHVGHLGIIDITHGMKAYRRDNGEYLVFLEDSGRARTIVYHWRP